MADKITDLAGSPKGILTELNPIRDFATLRKAVELMKVVDAYNLGNEDVYRNNAIDDILSKIGEVEATLLEKALTEKDIHNLECWCQSSLQSGDQLGDENYKEIVAIIKKVRELNKTLGGKSG